MLPWLFFLLLLKSQRTISLYIHRVFLATFSIWCITGTAVVVILLKRVWLWIFTRKHTFYLFFFWCYTYAAPKSAIPLTFIGRPLNLHKEDCLEIHLDGPFGAPASNIFRAEHAVLVSISNTALLLLLLANTHQKPYWCLLFWEKRSYWIFFLGTILHQHAMSTTKKKNLFPRKKKKRINIY